MGCFCKDGYYRNKNLQCVLPEECDPELLPAGDEEEVPSEPPVECPMNEIYDNCSSRCLEMCSNREDPIGCPINCDKGCFCRGSRLRNDFGLCVPIDECEVLSPDRPKPVCPEGEIFMECGNRCQELCPNTKQMFEMALDCDRCESGCFCSPGLLRGKSGACIAPKHCDRKNIIASVVSSIFNVIFARINFALGGRARAGGGARIGFFV